MGNDLVRLAEIQQRLGTSGRRLTEIGEELGKLAGNAISEAEVASALAEFDAVWEALTPRE